MINYWQWVNDNEKVEWFIDQLLAASSRPLQLSERDDAISKYPMGYRRSAARALCSLYKRIPNKIIRKSIIALSTDVNNEVRGFLFIGLRDLWLSDSKLVWACIDATITRANAFHEQKQSN